MPLDYAKRIAALLVEEPEEQITVDLHNDGFSDKVADVLTEMGYRVERYETRPYRLTIYRNAGEKED